MKTSFDKIMDPEYIGDYMQEYRKAGFLQTGSLQDVLDNRKKREVGDIISINLRDNNKLLYFVFLNAESSDNADFSVFFSRAFSSRGTEISKEDYLKIENCLNGLPPELKPYINDFVIIFNYAKNYCYPADDIRNQLNEVIDEKLAMDIRNFFISLLPKNNNLDIKQIDIKYTRGGGKFKTLTINSPILMKMMLFEFCKKYYTFFKSTDDENSESWLDGLYEKTQKDRKKNENGASWPDSLYEEPKKGRREKARTKLIRALVHITWLFMKEEKVCINKGKEYYYLIIGKILALSGGIDPYKELDNKTTYEDEKEYYTKILRKYWRPKEPN